MKSRKATQVANKTVVKTETKAKAPSVYSLNVLATNKRYKDVSRSIGAVVRQILVLKTDINLPAKYARALNATQKGSNKAEAFKSLVENVRFIPGTNRTCVFYVLQGLNKMDKAGLIK